MASTGLKGPYSLTEFGVENKVEPGVPGVYALGHTNKSGKFIVEYVGRSNLDVEGVAGRLKDWIGKYKQFKYDYYYTPREAYEKECRLYHDFGGSHNLDNKIHPARPDGAKYGCPVPDCPENN